MDIEIRRKKLRFRAAHRGLKELDLFIGSFAEASVSDMDDGQLDEFEAILDVPDNIMLDWIMGRQTPEYPAGGVLEAILKFEYPGGAA